MKKEKVKRIKRQPLPFIHLHAHDEYSLKDGVGSVEAYIKRASEMNSPGFTITNHGTNGQWIRQYFGLQEMNKVREEEGLEPIKNIFGEEVYLMMNREESLKRISEINSILESQKKNKKDDKLTPDEIQKLADERKALGKSYHLVILAQNQKGYENLLFLHNDAVMNGYYYRPNVSWEQLKNNSEGLIILSACLGGVISQSLLNNKPKKARKEAKMFKDVFGDNFYLELQLTDYNGQRETNTKMIEISEELDIPMVITNDSHYIYKEWSKAQKTLTLINSNSKCKSDKEGKGWIFEYDQLWYKTESEMFAEYKLRHSDYLTYQQYKKAILETVKIAEKIDANINFKENENHIPRFCETDEEADRILKKEINKGFKNRGLAGKKEYIDRIKFELDIIGYKEAKHYFLIVWDFINWTKKKFGEESVGDGRGSGASSLINYCLRITNIDPLFWKLPFERFLSKGRKDMPDIDTDFFPNIRDAVKQYLIEKYGQDYTASISTYGTYQTKAVIDDVCRTYSIPLSDVAKLKKTLIEDIDDLEDWDEILELNPKLEEFSETYPEVFQVIKTLRGQIRHMSKHPAGVLITKNPIMRDISLYRIGDTIVSSWVEGQTRSELGRIKRVKFDILGLETLQEQKYANDLIEKRTGKRINWKDVNLLTDKLSVKTVNSGDTKWIFQFQNPGMINLLKSAKITHLKDWSAISALGRPGAKRSGMADVFCKRSKGKEKYTLHPLLEEVLGETFGVLAYQEQVMFLGVVLADFTMDEADELRKILTKIKKETEHIYGKRRDELKEKFIQTASKKIGKKEAKEIWDLMVLFALYGFNKAHATCYGVISSRSLYLFTHHQIEFLAGILNSQKTKFVEDEESKMAYYIKEAKALGYEFIFPQINVSTAQMDVSDDDKIIYGLRFVKGVGDKASQAICSRKYKNIYDFFNNKPKEANKRVIEALVKVGFFDSLFENRKALWTAFEEWNEKKSGQFANYLEKYENIEDYKTEEISKFEMEFLGIYINNHPINKYEQYREQYDLLRIEEVPDYKNCSVLGVLVSIRPYKCKNGSLMAFSEIEDEDGKLSVSIFPKQYEKYKDILKPGKCLAMKVAVNNKGVSVDGYASGVPIMDMDDLLEINHKNKKVSKKKLTNKKK